MYLDDKGNPTKDSIFGWRSSGVPGSVAGFALAHKKFGTQKWQQLVEPAVKLASDGFASAPPWSNLFRLKTQRLSTDPESKRIFLRDGNPYKAGETFKQPELAETLQRIAQSGAKGFYEGPTAKAICRRNESAWWI